MPARKNPRHNERTRTAIQATQLVKRLQGHALGEIELTPSQVRAIEILLRKTLPDLMAIHQTSGDDTKSYEMWIREMEGIVADA